MLPSATSPESDPVLVALVAYAEALLPGLHLRPISIPEDGWVRQDDHFLRVQRSTVHWPIETADGFAYQSLAVHERQAALAALSDDQVLAGRVGRLVGWAGGSRLVGASDVLHAPISRALADSGGNLDRSVLSRHYSNALTDLRSETLTFRTVLPISGLFGDVDEIELADGVVLTQLSDEVVVKCISAGILRSRFGSTPLVPSTWFGVVLTTSASVLVQEEDVNGAVSPEAPAELTSMWVDISRRIDDALATLRLHRPERIAALGQLQFSDHWLQQGFLQYRAMPQGNAPSATYELAPSDGEPLRSLFENLQAPNVAGSRELQAALRRFGFADERELNEDAFVDLMIAAEAFYLGLDGTSARSELALRLSLRAGSIEEGGDVRQETFDAMKRAYKLRSRVVHGVPKPSDTEEMVALTNQVRGILRRGLVLAVTHLGQGASPTTFFPDFSELLTGSA